ncbi:uncharacterized protein LOC129968842 [Argiope bruennichi]|uniref:uncharacterized protein LOC129968842 n=1 Tax=Argiope bruennichi TaxID=94029 RepID=UPI00249481DF|nr:uncharacterized protein LOC129968842 [Argiope bruennichi]
MYSNKKIHLDSEEDDNNSLIDANIGCDFLSEFFNHSSEEKELNHAKFFLNDNYQTLVEDTTSDSSFNNFKPDNVKKNLFRKKIDLKHATGQLERENITQERKKKDPTKEYSPSLTYLKRKSTMEKNELKRAIKQLKKKNIIQERSIADYQIKLSQCMSDLLITKKELERTKSAQEQYEIENANLKCSVKQIEEELFQYKERKLKCNEENQKIQELGDTISVKMESTRRKKRNSATYHSQLAKKDAQLKKLQNHNKQLKILLAEFGNKLSEAGLLTKNYRMDILQKYGKEYFMPKASESLSGSDDLPEKTPGHSEISLGNVKQMDSDNFDTYIEDQNDTSSVAFPTPSVISSNEITSSICQSIDAFENELYNLTNKNEYSKNSTNPVVTSSNSQIDLTDSNEENDILDVDIQQTKSSAESGKNFYKNSDAMPTNFSGKLIPQNCIEKFSSVNTPNTYTNNQDLNISSSSSLEPSQSTGEEITSCNNIHAVSFQSKLVYNLPTKKESPEKNVSAFNSSNDTEQDKLCEFLSERVNPKNETIDPGNEGIIGNTLLQKQNVCFNQVEEVLKTAKVSSCNNILLPSSGTKSFVEEKKIKSCFEQTLSVGIYTEKESLPITSVSLKGDSPLREFNCTTSESAFKKNLACKQSPLKELGKRIINESKISDVSIQGTVFENKSVTNNLESASDFLETAFSLQDDQSLSDNESSDFDEFSKFENLFNMLRNPVSPLPPSPNKNSQFLKNESILKKDLEEIKENFPDSQLNPASKLNKDKKLLYAKDNLLQSGPSVSAKNFALETLNDLKFDIQQKFVEQCKSLDKNVVHQLVYEIQDTTSNIFHPELRECYVLLSRCDIPKYFSSTRKQISFHMFDNNQKNSIPENSNLITSYKANDLVLDDSNNKTSVKNQNKTADIKYLSTLPAFSENESDTRCGYDVSYQKPFSTINIKNIACYSQLLPLSKTSNFHKEEPLNDLIHDTKLCTKDCNACSELKNSHESNISRIVTDGTSSVNMIELSTNRKKNILKTSEIQECFVKLSRSDISNYFRNLRNKTPSQIVHYYNNQLTNSPLKNTSPETFLESKDNNYFPHDDSTISAHVVYFDNMQQKNKKINNLLETEMPDENHKLISCFNNVENSFKSVNLQSAEFSMFDDNNTSDRIKSPSEKLAVSNSQNLSTEIYHKNASIVSVELPINNEHSLKSLKSQNGSLVKCHVPSADSNNITDRLKLLNKKSSVSISQNSSGAKMYHDNLSVDSVEESINHFNQNSAKSENCSLPVATFQNSSDIETFHESSSAISLELPINTEPQEYPMKRKRSETSNCNFSKKTSLKKWCRDFFDNKPLLEKRSTILLPGPSASTKWKKSSILNGDSLPSESKTIQTESCTPTYPSLKFQKKITSILETKNSLKKKIKPLDSGMTCVAPIRINGRTSKSKAFVKISCNKDINNSRISNRILSKEVDISLPQLNHEENMENYININPPKVRKQYKRKSSSETHVLDNVNKESPKLLEQSVSSLEQNQLDTKSSPEQVNKGCEKQNFPLIKSEDCIDIKINKNIITDGNGHDEDFSCRKEAFSDSVIKINHNSTEDFMENNSSNVSHCANEICSNSFEQSIPSQADLHTSGAEFLKQSKQINATNLFFDFLQKETSKKYRVDQIKQYIDKQLLVNKNKSKFKNSKKLSVNKSESKLKNESKHSINTIENKLKNCSKKLLANKSKHKLKNKKKNLPVSKFENKLKTGNEKSVKAEIPTKMNKLKIEKLSENITKVSSPLSDILHGIESVQSTDEKFKQYLHSLINFLINPLHSPDLENLIYLVVNFLHLNRENYFIDLPKIHSEYCFLPSAESCIVEALFTIQNDSKMHMQCLIKTFVHILHQLILTKIKFNIYGLASLCRVLAAICKRNDDKAEILSLCYDILKVKHPFGPYLIASVVVVWKEAFTISDNMSENEMLLRCLSLGFQKKPDRLSKNNWNYCLELLTGLLPCVPDVNKVIEFLKNRILIKCLDNSFEELWKLSSPFLILVSQMPWDWIKTHIIDMYIIPNLQRFSRHDSKEEAFDLFCNLCVEVLLFNKKLNEDEILNMFYENLSLTGKNFVRDCVAASLMKYFILSKRTVPPFLENWLKNNQDNPKLRIFENIFQQRLMSEHPEILSKQDIIK